MRFWRWSACAEQVTPHLLITEIRTIAADDLWMSTCYRRPSVTIHFTWKPDWPAVRRVLPLIEKELSGFEGSALTGESCSRCHRPSSDRGTRSCPISGNWLPGTIPGKFRNDFLNTNLFAG